MKLKKRWMSLMLVFALLISAAFPVTASAATNKAIKVAVSFDGKEQKTDEEWDQHTYGLKTWFTGTTRLTASTVSYATVYIPKSIFTDGEGVLSFWIDLYMIEYINKQYQAVGSMNTDIGVYVEYRNKKASLSVYNTATGKKLKASKYATLKTKGNFLVLTFKSTYGNTYYSLSKDKNVKLDTKTKYSVSPCLVIHGDAGKIKGNIYLDKISLKTKTWSSKRVVTFNNSKNYRTSECFSFRYDGTQVKTNLKPVKIK